MKSRLVIRFIFTVCIGAILLMEISGCGAIGALINVILGSEFGWACIPILSLEKNLQSSEEGQTPGMIIIKQDPSGVNWKGLKYAPLSNVIVQIQGDTRIATTDEKGYFLLSDIQEGTPALIARKTGFVPFSQDVPVSFDTSTDSIDQFYVIPTNMHIITKHSRQIQSYAKSKDNHIIEPEDVTWGILNDKVAAITDGKLTYYPNNNNVYVDSKGLFTAISNQVSGTGENSILQVDVQAKFHTFSAITSVIISPGSGSLKGKVLLGGNGVSGARVEIPLTSYFTTTDGNGNYFFPEVPANYPINVTAQNADQTASSIVTVPEGGQATLDLVIETPPVSNFVYEKTIGDTGVSGTGNYQFNQPEGIAFDGNGNFYVADTLNDRIQKFDPNNTYLSTIQGDFHAPTGLAVDKQNKLYVTDNKAVPLPPPDDFRGRISIYNNGNPPSTEILAGGTNKLNHPLDIVISQFGDMFVTDFRNFCVRKLDSSGNWIRDFGTEHSVQTATDADPNHFGDLSPTGIGIDGNDFIYVADTRNHRVQIYSSFGSYVATMGVTGIPGTDKNHFNNPVDIAVDSAGNIYVVDHLNHRVQMFDKNRNYLDTIGVTGSAGTSNDKLNEPASVAISPVNGKIYVTDALNHRIQIFRR